MAAAVRWGRPPRSLGRLAVAALSAASVMIPVHGYQLDLDSQGKLLYAAHCARALRSMNGN